MKEVTRKKLSTILEDEKDNLKRNIFMLTCIRATKNKSLQIEVAQNRALGSGKLNMLQILNRSDERFKGETTMVYDWMTLKPADFKKAFPNVDLSIEQMEQIANTWDPDAPTGKDSKVFPILATVKTIYDSVNDEHLTPVITVTEVIESELNGKFFTGSDAEEKAQDVIDRGRRAMRTSSDPDAEYIVDAATGERIYRFTRTMFKEHGAKDTLIANKTTESEFKNRQPVLGEASSEDLKNKILGESASI